MKRFFMIKNQLKTNKLLNNNHLIKHNISRNTIGIIHFKTIIMNYLKAIQEISEIIPDIEMEFEEKKNRSSYSVINAFTNRIKTMIANKERNLLFKSLKKMNDIYRNGDIMLKYAVECTFIYSLDNSTAFCSKEYRKVIFSHISNDLQKLYSKQIYSHGT